VAAGVNREAARKSRSQMASSIAAARLSAEARREDRRAQVGRVQRQGAGCKGPQGKREKERGSVNGNKNALFQLWQLRGCEQCWGVAWGGECEHAGPMCELYYCMCQLPM
jgi:hypothetical protein